MAGDRYVLIRSADGPVSGRIVGLLTANEEGRALTLRATEARTPVTAVRVTSVSKEVHDRALGIEVAAECPPTVRSDLGAALSKLNPGRVEFGRPGVTITCENGVFHVESRRRLLHTPFWTPSLLTVTTLKDVVALISAAHGELDLALYALDAGGSLPVRAGLALEAGWLLEIGRAHV
jgi:hypothetical protein